MIISRGHVDLSNYYESDPAQHKNGSGHRYPKNHVKFSPLLKPLEWFDRLCTRLGFHAFQLKCLMLREFDSAGSLDECMGTREELNQNRNLILSYCEGLDGNPFLSSNGRLMTMKISLDLLKIRKKVLTYYHKNKKFIDQHGKLKAPVIVTGLPRSGTTLLQRLMSEDPNTRSPYNFELEMPIPPMGRNTHPLKDPRIKSRSSLLTASARFAPGFLEKFAESHFLNATEMEESFIYMLMHNGMHLLGSALAGRKYVSDLLKMEDKRPIFRYERLFFTMLDAYRPAKSHWTLKAPNYAPCFPLIFEEYPDARVVITHRNPLLTLPSVCRLLESWCIPCDQNGCFDKHIFGQFNKKFVDDCLMVPFNFRKDHPEKENRIFDCVYEPFFADPIAMVKRIYEKFDLAYTPAFERRMRAYLENNKQGKYGRHKYSLEEYGFEEKGLFEEYKAYMDHFGFGIPGKNEKPVSFDFGLVPPGKDH